MARVDKTNSAIGVVRGVLAADLNPNLFDKVTGVGINSTGKVVVGAGQTGIVGVLVPNRLYSKAGAPVDIFKIADIVDVGKGANDTALAAGTTYWVDGTTGALVAGGTLGAQPGSGAGSTAGSVKLGYTVEADRLIISL